MTLCPDTPLPSHTPHQQSLSESTKFLAANYAYKVAVVESRFPQNSQILHVSESEGQNGARVPSGSILEPERSPFTPLLCNCSQGLVSHRRHLLTAMGALSATTFPPPPVGGTETGWLRRGWKRWSFASRLRDPGQVP